MPKKNKSIKHSKTKHNKTKHSKQNIKKVKKGKFSIHKDDKDDKDIQGLSLEDRSLLDFKQTKSFSVATSLSQYKSKSHIGELYDYKPLHDKINNLCINKITTKEPSLNKKNSKTICECLFNKNKDLSISDLESKVNQKKDIPSSNCITLFDKFTKIKTNNSRTTKNLHKNSNKNLNKNSNKLSNKSTTK